MGIDTTVGGPWVMLFHQALKLMDSIPNTPPQQWSFGGGTVLMLRHRHRLSNDIDLFVRDPQVLGYLSPRLSDVAADITGDYEEAAEFLKLYLPEGQIDIVASRPLTANPYEATDIFGREVWVETSAEIVAKKMFYRGNTPKARDIYDMALVLEKEPKAMAQAAEHCARHRRAFLNKLESNKENLKTQFEQIKTLEYNPSFDDAVKAVKTYMARLSRYIDRGPSPG